MTPLKFAATSHVWTRAKSRPVRTDPGEKSSMESFSIVQTSDTFAAPVIGVVVATVMYPVYRSVLALYLHRKGFMMRMLLVFTCAMSVDELPFPKSHAKRREKKEGDDGA